MHWLHHVGVWCDTISSGPPFNVILQRLSYFYLGRLDLARYASKIPSWVWINIFWSHPGRPSKSLITIFTTRQLPILHHLVENKIFKDMPMSMPMSCHAASAGVCNCHWSLQQFLIFLPPQFFSPCYQFYEIRFDPILNELALLHFLVETFSPHIFGGPRLQTSPLSNPISTQFVEYVGYQNYGACWNDPKTILSTSVNVGHTKQKKEFEIKTNNVLNNPAIPM